MIEEGRLRTCDICGATIFSKLTAIQGIDSIKSYEENDAGWRSIEIPCRDGDDKDNIVGIYRDLCPECLHRYYELTMNFIHERG